MISPVRLGVSPAATTPTDFLLPEVLGLYFPTLEPWVVWSVLLPSCSSRLCPHKCGIAQPLPHLPGLPVAALPCILSAQAARLHPSYRSG